MSNRKPRKLKFCTLTVWNIWFFAIIGKGEKEKTIQNNRKRKNLNMVNKLLKLNNANDIVASKQRNIFLPHSLFQRPNASRRSFSPLLFLLLDLSLSPPWSGIFLTDSLYWMFFVIKISCIGNFIIRRRSIWF